MPVVDASVIVDLIAPDVGPDSPARALFAGWARSGAELLAPGLLWLETANALLTGIRRGRWSGADADSAAVLLRRLLAHGRSFPRIIAARSIRWLRARP